MNTITRTESIAAKLGMLPAFSELGKDGLCVLAGIVEVRRFPKGAIIVGQGDSSACMYLLVAGRVKVSLRSGEGREIVLHHIEAPAHFNEAALVGQESRTADTYALTDVEVLVLTAEHLSAAVGAEPRLALSIIAALSSRLRQTVSRLEDMAFHDATHRVMRVMLNAASNGIDEIGGAAIEGMTHYDIATLAGTSRETASRVISSLARKGVVTTEGRRINVDLESLTNILQPAHL